MSESEWVILIEEDVIVNIIKKYYARIYLFPNFTYCKMCIRIILKNIEKKKLVIQNKITTCTPLLRAQGYFTNATVGPSVIVKKALIASFYIEFADLPEVYKEAGRSTHYPSDLS